MSNKKKTYKLNSIAKEFRIGKDVYGPGDSITLNHKQAVAFRDKLDISPKEREKLAEDSFVRGLRKGVPARIEEIVPPAPHTVPFDPAQDPGGLGDDNPDSGDDTPPPGPPAPPSGPPAGPPK